MKTMTVILMVLAMVIGTAMSLIAADLPQARQGLLANYKPLPDADLAPIAGKFFPMSVTLATFTLQASFPSNAVLELNLNGFRNNIKPHIPSTYTKSSIVTSYTPIQPHRHNSHFPGAVVFQSGVGNLSP
jgi:hypothetical protein